MSGDFTAREERDLRKRLESGEEIPCPRCGGLLHAAPVIPPPEVSYVRNRVLLLCPSCGRRAAVDRKTPP